MRKEVWIKVILVVSLIGNVTLFWKLYDYLKEFKVSEETLSEV